MAYGLSQDMGGTLLCSTSIETLTVIDQPPVGDPQTHEVEVLHCVGLALYIYSCHGSTG